MKLWRTCPLAIAAVLAGGAVFGGCQTRGKLAPPAPVVNWAARFSPGRARLQEDWERWGKKHLRDGDLIFVMGESRILLGLLNFSRFSADIAQSDFSHVGMIAVEDGRPIVYDIIDKGPLRRPFGEYVADARIWSVAVKRLHPRWGNRGPAAIAFCREVHQSGREFDDAFRLDNDRYYCSEMVELAYRRTGRPLSTPLRIRDLPGFARFPAATVRLIEATTSISAEQEVFLPGNDEYGIWSSPHLTTVLPKTDALAPPQ